MLKRTSRGLMVCRYNGQQKESIKTFFNQSNLLDKHVCIDGDGAEDKNPKTAQNKKQTPKVSEFSK